MKPTGRKVTGTGRLGGRLALASVAAAIVFGTACVPGVPVAAQSLFDPDGRPSFEQQRRRQREEDRRSRSERRADYCRQLEQRLVQEWRRNNETRSELPKLRQELREAEKGFRTAKAKAERGNCYEETFFFGRSLRRTPECVELDRQVQRARREFNDLRERIDRISHAGARQSLQDDLIAELARYGCGEDYQRQYEARRPSFFSFFDERGTSFREPESRRRDTSDLPFSTYRTMCVRRCDGYYFPVSFSTLPSQFSADEAQCSERCAAPTELFVYRNPGEDVEQMVSLSGKPYREMDTAWLYRKKFINGCSCDAAEYSMEEIAKAKQEMESAQSSDPDAARESQGEDASGEDGRRAETGQAGEDGLIIRDVPRDIFDPRRR